MRVIALLAFGIVVALGGCDFGSASECDGGDCGGQPIDPGCLGEGQGYCAADVRFLCSADGSSYDDQDCAAESPPRTCVKGATSITFCAVTPEQDARCEADPWATTCDAGVLTVCREGFVEEITACPGGACIELEGHRSFCAISTERDPRCMNEGTGLDRRFCQDNWIIDCVDGYGWRFLDCDRQQCFEYDDYASCG